MHHLVLLALLAPLAAACTPELKQRWPGPCEARWSLYERVTFLHVGWTTPVLQGPPRVMRFTWDDQQRLIQMEDDADGDGIMDVTVSYRDRPAESAPHIWSACQGECVWDEHGNLLQDSAPDGQDVLRYDYGCWLTP